MKFPLRFVLTIVSALYLTNALSHADDASASLARVKSFAFGGVGAAGITSPGEALFKSVLADGKALDRFRNVLAHGTPEAKLYALCGIRDLDRASFEEAAAPLSKSNPEVETIAGCMIMRQPAKSVIVNIAAGRYDLHFHSKR